MEAALLYFLTPLAAWTVAGGLKFLINSLRARRLAFDLIGYGGLPSNHAAVVCSTAALVGLREGWAHPAFGVAWTLAFIVMLDAASLRRQIGRQAEAINRLAGGDATPSARLRERLGHTPLQLLAGAVTGVGVAVAMNTGMLWAGG